MTLVKKNNGCEIGNKWYSFKFEYEKRAGYFNGVKIHYLFAATFAPPEPLISEKDYDNVITPLIKGNSILPRKNIRNIVLDPGHGGKDHGAQTKYLEKDINLAIAKALRDELRRRGYNVFMTRDSDYLLDLEKRPEKAAFYKADLFISIHCNSASSRYIRGVETYLLTPEGSPSTSDKKKSASFQRGNAYNKQNVLLAYLIQRCILGNTGTDDRGVRHARFAVLKTAPCPAVLVECGFLTNEWEMKNLAWSNYQKGIAEGIAEGIAYYSRSLK
ncbi:MAG TPA: N-acetylmuramoyl-L-alanine amidase [Victivallales bacterium]|nr:N-acetylmuramoyl-L-alanine amidase [Victivallales bacterium]